MEPAAVLGVLVVVEAVYKRAAAQAKRVSYEVAFQERGGEALEASRGVSGWTGRGMLVVKVACFFFLDGCFA